MNIFRWLKSKLTRVAIVVCQLPTKPITIKDVCTCSGEGQVMLDNSYHNYELVSGQHTGFLLTKCTICNKIGGFPQDNLILAINEGTSITKDILTEVKSVIY